MPTRLLLEGKEIEVLLQQVRSDYGQYARIVHAERVRTGGLVGFFAKERYEVEVEIDDAYVAKNQTQAPVSSPGPSRSALSLPTAQVTRSDEEPLALLLAEAMNQVTDDLVGQSAPGPKPSTSGAAFAQVLGSVANGLGVESALEPSAQPIAQQNSNPNPKPRGKKELELPEPGNNTQMLVSIYGNPQNSVVSPVTSSELAVVETLPTKAVKPPRGPGQVLAVVGEAVEAFSAGIELAKRMRIQQSRVLLAAPEPVIPGLAANRRLGDALTARKRSLKFLSESMPSVVAIDLPISAIWNEELAEWAEEMVTAVGAIEVWAVVDATRKPADLARWLAQLNRVDALIVHNARATDDLKSVLDLGYPVAVLDDLPATNMLWRSMLHPGGDQSS